MRPLACSIVWPCRVPGKAMRHGQAVRVPGRVRSPTPEARRLRKAPKASSGAIAPCPLRCQPLVVHRLRQATQPACRHLVDHVENGPANVVSTSVPRERGAALAAGNPLRQCRCLPEPVLKACRCAGEMARNQVWLPAGRHRSLRISGSDGGYRCVGSGRIGGVGIHCLRSASSHDCPCHCEPVGAPLRSGPPRRTNGPSPAHFPPARRTPDGRSHLFFDVERELHDSGR